MEWSPDGRQIVFKGDLKTGGSEVGVVSIDGSTKGIRVLTKEQTETDFSWHPEGTRILMVRHSRQHAGNRLFVYDLQTEDLSSVAGIPPDVTVNGCDWSPDGRQIVLSGWRPTAPVPWTPSTEDHLRN
jgi:Tol biopolymer transport system component